MVEKEAKEEIIPESGPDENIESLKKALADEKAKAEANLAGWQRAQADFVNYKRFAEQEKLETGKYVTANTLMIFLPILDDLDRAMAALPADESKKKWTEGFRLIEKKFRDILEKQGLAPIKAVGEEFDCRSMDAVGCVHGEKDIVIKELEKGYALNEKIIRPAKVIVGDGEEAEKEE